jgi:DNA-binding protein HU-beta
LYCLSKVFQGFFFGLLYKGIFVNKTQLIDFVASTADLPKNKAGCAVDAMLEGMMQSLVKGEDVTLVGFLTLTVKKRAARIGRNPKTGAPLNIAESNAVVCRAGKGLKDAVNGVQLALKEEAAV